MAATKLPRDQFLRIVEATPLVSIDLILRDSDSRILLGQRLNSPARGHWFAPGGRIYKDENLETAFARISLTELGHKLDFSEAGFFGAYTHLYADNFAEVEGISTHYVVLAYELRVETGFRPVQDDQHGLLEWFSDDDPNPLIHPYTRAYMRS